MERLEVANARVKIGQILAGANLSSSEEAALLSQMLYDRLARRIRPPKETKSDGE
jgi:hypothetical protein